MNRNGFLLGEETVKLILAVIAILFLVMFVVYLYNNFSQNKELEQAKSSLTHLISELDAGSTEVEIFNPNNWALSSFQESNLPNKCSSAGWKNCICICIKPGTSTKTPLLACDATGTCQESNFIIDGGKDITGLIQNHIEIQNPPLILSIDQQTKTIQKNL